jgi:hypothetical protein
MHSKVSRVLVFNIISLLLLISFAGSAFAADMFDVSFQPILSRITPEEVAAYNITLTNYASEERIYSISLTAGEATSWMISPNFIKVPGNSTVTEVLNIFPKSTTSIGVYSLSISFTHKGDVEKLAIPLSMNFEGFYTDYTPNVALTITAPDVQDPRDSMKVSIRMINRNMLDIKNLTLRIRSDVFYKEINTSIGPRKERSVDAFFDLEPLESPGTYKLYVEAYYPLTDKIIADAETEFKINKYSTINQVQTPDNNWFVKRLTISIQNEGNYEDEKEISVIMPWYKRMFSSTNKDTELTRVDGKSYITWTPTLKPMESQTLIVTTNYRLLVIALLLIIAGIVAYYMFRSPIVLLKDAHVLEQDEHGISEIKVKIYIKNRSRSELEHITITDKVPGITDYIESNNMGSMKPSRVTKTTSKGTILHWDFDKLDALEERLITYKLKSKLKVVGDMSLPKSRVKFTYGSSKRERFVISPTPLFYNNAK